MSNHPNYDTYGLRVDQVTMRKSSLCKLIRNTDKSVKRVLGISWKENEKIYGRGGVFFDYRHPLYITLLALHVVFQLLLAAVGLLNFRSVAP